MTAAPRTVSKRRDTLNLRIKPEERGLIDRAALATGKTRTDFVLDAARGRGCVARPRHACCQSGSIRRVSQAAR